MKVVLAGGSGHVGALLIRHFRSQNADITLLSRKSTAVDGVRTVVWDGKNPGSWAAEIDGADVVINLAGRTVNCRYNAENLRQMMESRVDSTRAVGQAIQAAKNPPAVWLQSSTANIYAHRFDAPNDEATGILGGNEVGEPPKWVASIEIAKACEAALDAFETPRTRKVALRSAMTMATDPGSVFDVLYGLTRNGLGGTLGTGRQYVSWIHEFDFARAIQFLIDGDLAGPVNLASPNPLPQAEFAADLRAAAHRWFGLPALAWMVEIGCLAMRIESELVLKSRRVVPGRLFEAGFTFDFPTWPAAAADLVRRSRRQ